VWRAIELRSEVCSCAQAKTRGHIDCRVLPHGAFGASEAPNVEAVHTDDLTGLLRFDVTLRGRRGRLALIGVRIACDQRQTPRASRQTVALEHPLHAVL
jgi:hypothetical protein